MTNTPSPLSVYSIPWFAITCNDTQKKGPPFLRGLQLTWSLNQKNATASLIHPHSQSKGVPSCELEARRTTGSRILSLSICPFPRNVLPQGAQPPTLTRHGGYLRRRVSRFTPPGTGLRCCMAFAYAKVFRFLVRGVAGTARSHLRAGAE